MKKKTIVTFILIFIAVIIFLFGILIYNLKTVQGIGTLNSPNVDNIKNVQSSPIAQTSIEEAKISPNAIITFFKHYTECNHTIQVTENVTSDIVNMSQNEFANMYSDWSIRKFTNTEIELSKNFSGNCGEHFLVKSNEDGFVDIYTIKDDNSLELKEQTEIALKYLSSADVNELKSGMILYGKNNLNAYIENFE